MNAPSLLSGTSSPSRLLGATMRATLLCLALLVSALPAPAHAAGGKAKPSGEGEAALASFRAGEALYALGHFREALEKFETAYKLKPVQGLLFNIAQCHRQLKQFELAVTTYRSFIRLAPENAQVEKAKALIEECEGALRAQAGAVSALPLDSGGTEPAAKKIPIRVPPKEPAPPPPAPLVVVATPAAPPPEAPRVASAGPAAAPSPRAEPAARPTPPAKASEAPAEALRGYEPAAGEGTRTATWVTAGAAVVALGAGAAFGVMSKSTASSLSGQQHTRAEVDSLQGQMESQGSKANLLFIAGGVLAVAAGALFVLHL
jgi:hypothetical protein